MTVSSTASASLPSDILPVAAVQMVSGTSPRANQEAAAALSLIHI